MEATHRLTGLAAQEAIRESMNKGTTERLPGYASRLLTKAPVRAFSHQMPSLQWLLPLDSRNCCSHVHRVLKRLR